MYDVDHFYSDRSGHILRNGHQFISKTHILTDSSSPGPHRQDPGTPHPPSGLDPHLLPGVATQSPT